GNAETIEIVETARQSTEVADAVAIRVEKRLDVHAIEDGVVVPEITDHQMPNRIAAWPPGRQVETKPPGGQATRQLVSTPSSNAPPRSLFRRRPSPSGRAGRGWDGSCRLRAPIVRPTDRSEV